MPIIRTKYIVYTHSGSGVRHHHFGTEANIIDDATGNAQNGDTIPAQGFPFQEFNGQLVQFAFMSVNGAGDGNHLYTSPGNQTVKVGSTDVNILVVYAPPGGIGVGGGPGIWVDAFNVDTGAFSDSLDFIKVLTPPTPPDTVDAAKTTFGNQDGGVSTQTAENVRCNDHVDGVPFVEWKQITGSQTTQTDRTLHLAQNQSGQIWFAFYQTPESSPPAIKHVIDVIVGGIFLWTGDDTCGNGGHWVFPHGGGPGPGPGFTLTLDKATIRGLSPDQKKQVDALAKDYSVAAQTGLASMTKTLEILNKINSIVSKGKG